ncbi:MAG: prolyl-tRNA synthetase associated domain-containing protein [Alphaproteobacteria bacterium]|nr:prolyl-tRNA synthetase associated domain-containing protein [Alphaproteobacteria bacterium]
MDSTAAFDDAGLFARLDELGIACETHAHPPLFTVEQSRALRGDLPGAHIKNLFLRDKKRRMWLVTVLESRDIDLKALRRRIGAQGTLSFGDPALLMAHLGVTPGAVTPFAVINDRAGNVTMVLDSALQAGGVVNAHPLRNDRTSAIGAGDLARFLEAEGHPPLIVDFDSKDED